MRKNPLWSFLRKYIWGVKRKDYSFLKITIEKFPRLRVRVENEETPIEEFESEASYISWRKEIEELEKEFYREKVYPRIIETDNKIEYIFKFSSQI